MDIRQTLSDKKVLAGISAIIALLFILAFAIVSPNVTHPVNQTIANSTNQTHPIHYPGANPTKISACGSFGAGDYYLNQSITSSTGNCLTFTGLVTFNGTGFNVGATGASHQAIVLSAGSAGSTLHNFTASSGSYYAVTLSDANIIIYDMTITAGTSVLRLTSTNATIANSSVKGTSALVLSGSSSSVTGSTFTSSSYSQVSGNSNLLDSDTFLGEIDIPGNSNNLTNSVINGTSGAFAVDIRGNNNFMNNLSNATATIPAGSVAICGYNNSLENSILYEETEYAPVINTGLCGAGQISGCGGADPSQITSNVTLINITAYGYKKSGQTLGSAACPGIWIQSSNDYLLNVTSYGGGVVAGEPNYPSGPGIKISDYASYPSGVFYSNISMINVTAIGGQTFDTAPGSGIIISGNNITGTGITAQIGNGGNPNPNVCNMYDYGLITALLILDSDPAGTPNNLSFNSLSIGGTYSGMTCQKEKSIAIYGPGVEYITLVNSGTGTNTNILINSSYTALNSNSYFSINNITQNWVIPKDPEGYSNASSYIKWTSGVNLSTNVNLSMIYVVPGSLYNSSKIADWNYSSSWVQKNSGSINTAAGYYTINCSNSAYENCTGSVNIGLFDQNPTNASLWNGTNWITYNSTNKMPFVCDNPPTLCSPTNQNSTQSILLDSNQGVANSTYQTIVSDTTWGAEADFLCGITNDSASATKILTTATTISTSNITMAGNESIWCWLNVRTVSSSFPRSFNLTVVNH